MHQDFAPAPSIHRAKLVPQFKNEILQKSTDPEPKGFIIDTKKIIDINTNDIPDLNTNLNNTMYNEKDGRDNAGGEE